MYKKIYFVTILICLFSSIKGQLVNDVFPLSREFYPNGFYIAPLLTYNFPWEEKATSQYQNTDSVYNYTNSTEGKFAYGFELGMYQTFKNNRIIDYIEGGVSYRKFEGKGNHQGLLQTSDTLKNFTSNNKFSYSQIGGVFRVVRADQLGRYTFLNTAIGVNAGYRLSYETEQSQAYPNNYEKEPEELFTQAHFQIGLGIRLTELILFIPSIEVPFMNLTPFEPFEPRFDAIGNKKHPVLFSLTFMFLKKDPMNCNAPTYNGIPQ